MIQVLAMLTLAAVLTGCSTPVVPREVKVPVVVRCDVDMPSEPAWATGAITRDSGIFDQVKSLLAEREQAKGYQDELRSALEACADDDLDWNDEDDSAD